MSYELEIEATTLTAIAIAIEKGDHAPEEFTLALHGVASRLKGLAKCENS